jgi:hypothetical protein
MAPKNSANGKKAVALDQALRGMFRKLEARPVPDHISGIVDQLEATAQPEPRRKSGTKGG